MSRLAVDRMHKTGDSSVRFYTRVFGPVSAPVHNPDLSSSFTVFILFVLHRLNSVLTSMTVGLYSLYSGPIPKTTYSKNNYIGECV